MKALCHRCGKTKKTAMQPCPACRAIPCAEDDIATSLLLTDDFLSREGFRQAAVALKEGRGVEFPTESRVAVIVSYRQAQSHGKPHSEGLRDSVGFGKVMAVALVILAVAGWFHPWPHYRWAQSQDSIEGYETFIHRFPNSAYREEAQDRLHLLGDDVLWDQARKQHQIGPFRLYLKSYPEGKHATEAREKTVEIADHHWYGLSRSLSEAELRDFLTNYPETTMAEAAEQRILHLYDDVEWLKQQDRLQLYQHFVQRFPDHPQSYWIQKRIVDLEVAAIAEGPYISLPPSHALGRGGDIAEVGLANATGHELTVRYSGPDSKKVILSAGQKTRLRLLPGDYRVTATVNSDRIIHGYGKDSLQGGLYAAAVSLGQQPVPESPAAAASASPPSADRLAK